MQGGDIRPALLFKKDNQMLDQSTAALFRAMFRIDSADMVSLPESLVAMYDRLFSLSRAATRRRPDGQTIALLVVTWQELHPKDHAEFLRLVRDEQQGVEEADVSWLDAWKGYETGTPVVVNRDGAQKPGTLFSMPQGQRDKDAGLLYISIDGERGQYKKIKHEDVRLASPVAASN